MLVPFDIKFIRLDQKHVGLDRQASPFLRWSWSRLINLISEGTKMVFSIYLPYFFGDIKKIKNLNLFSRLF